MVGVGCEDWLKFYFMGAGQGLGLVAHRWPFCNDDCISCCYCCLSIFLPAYFSNLCTILFYSSFVFYEQRTRERNGHTAAEAEAPTR